MTLSKHRKRVCIIGPYPPIKGGISQYNEFLVRQLKKESDVYVYSYKRQYPSFLIKNREQVDNKHIASGDNENKIDWSLDSLNPFTWLKVINEIRSIKPAAIIMPWWVVYWAPMYFILLISFRMMNIKSLLICHNVFDHEENAVKRVITKTVLKMADICLVHSESERKKISKVVGDKASIKHLLPLFHFSEKSEADIKDIRRGSELKLLFFGFVREYKGLDLLLNTLAELNNENMHLSIVGEFWGDKSKYTDIIINEKIPNVTVVDDYVTDSEVGKYFKEADLVVLPYKSATGSAVIATAYGYHKPVLVTNVGGLPDAVRDKETGVIVEPTTESMKCGLSWFLENKDAVDFENNIRKFTEETMSWSSLCDEIYSALQVDADT